MRTHPGQLDAASLRYLQAVDATSGEGFPGAFVRRKPSMLAGPRGGWPVALFAGVVGLLGGTALFLPQAFDRLDLELIPYFQVAFFTSGVFLALGGLARYRRPEEVPLVRDFVFADACRVWDVSPTRVVTLELTADTAIDARHLYARGVYEQSVVTLSGPGGTRTWVLADEAAVNRLAAFVRAVAALRQSADLELAGASAGRLGALADRAARFGPGADWAYLLDAGDPPRPLIDPHARVGGRSRWPSRVVRGLAAAAAAAIGLWALPGVTAARHDDYLFGRVPAYDNGSPAEIDAYLERYPEGRHAAEARALRDDRGFSRAERQAKAADSPAPYREYLADPANARHRDEARRRVAGFYDRAVADVRARRKRNPDPDTRELAAALVALLDGLKDAPEPVVTVAFRGQVDPVPATDRQKAREAEAHAQRSREPRPAGSAARSTDIVGPGEAFAPDQEAHREQAALDRLAAVLKRTVKPDLVTLKPAPAGGRADVEIRYHVRPSGTLSWYNRVGFDGPPEVAGLLRGYEVEWEVVVRPPGGGPKKVCRLPGRPLDEGRYEPGPSDPVWAPYAVALYAEFYALSDRLIRGFGLDPGMPPVAFAYPDVIPSRPAAYPVDGERRVSLDPAGRD